MLISVTDVLELSDEDMSQEQKEELRYQMNGHITKASNTFLF
jgi:hypothetical protein